MIDTKNADVRRLLRLGGVVVREERVIPRWKNTLAWVWLVAWVATAIGGVAAYAFWEGWFEALRLSGCAL